MLFEQKQEIKIDHTIPMRCQQVMRERKEESDELIRQALLASSATEAFREAIQEESCVNQKY
jgi:hypothetical protein